MATRGAMPAALALALPLVLAHPADPPGAAAQEAADQSLPARERADPPRNERTGPAVQKPEAQPAEAAAGAPPGAAPAPRHERPDAMVRALYRAIDAKDVGVAPLDWTEPATARRLFVPALAALAEEEGRRPVPDRRLPFDPFTGALQIRPTRLALRVSATTADTAEVGVHFSVSGTARSVTYRLVRAGPTWRIADIWWGGDKQRSFARLLR